MRFSQQRLVWSGGLAIVAHGVLALLWPRLDIEFGTLSEGPILTIQLYQHEPKNEERLLAEPEEQEALEPSENRDTATVQTSASELDTHEHIPSRVIVTSISSLRDWASEEAKKHGQQEEKVDLSTLRQGSYVEQWLDPNRVDTKDSDKDTKISVTGGTIWVKKVNGKLICSFVSHDGKASGFNCAAPQRNQFIDDSGSIKNSDRVDW